MQTICRIVHVTILNIIPNANSPKLLNSTVTYLGCKHEHIIRMPLERAGIQSFPSSGKKTIEIFTKTTNVHSKLFKQKPFLKTVNTLGNETTLKLGVISKIKYSIPHAQGCKQKLLCHHEV